MALAAAAALACSTGGDAGPRPRSVQPAQGAEGTALTVRIEGDGLEPHVLTDYGDEGASLVDARFRAWLGTSRLRDVHPAGDGALSATVPEDLPAGTYDLAVEDPAGNRATLPAAYRVLAPSDAGALVASFRVDPVAAQVAGVPFAITVTALDASGQLVTGFNGSAAISDRTGALVPASVGPFAWGVWTGPIELRAALAADALAVADGLGHAGASNDFAVVPAPAARVVFTSPAVDAIAGACVGPVTIALEDLYGAPTAAAAPVDVAVSGGVVAVYADPGCAISAPGATLTVGASSASVYVRSTLATPFTLDATSAGLAPAVQPGLVRPAAPARLVFTTAPQTVTAGTCSAAAAVRAEDAYGNVSPALADTAVALSVTAGSGLTFHDAAGCAAAAVPAVTLPAGGSTVTFWFRGTAAQPVTVTAAGAGIPGAGTQGEAIDPAPPVALAFVTASQAIAVGNCSGAAIVEARDALGNAAPVTAATLVALAAVPAAPFTFHLDPACADAPVAATAMAAGASQASFRFRATATGLYDVSAAGAGLPGVAAQAETIGPSVAALAVVTSAPKTVKAGQCSGPVTVEVRDGLGNASPVATSTPVALAASPSTGTALFASADCSGPAGGPATIPAGAATATFSFRSTTAGVFDATATVAGLLPGSQAEMVQPEAPDRLVFTTGPQTLTAGACATATIEARDGYGNVAPVASLTSVALSATPAAGFRFFGSAGCGGGPVASADLAAGASSTAFWFQGTVAGSVTITATGTGLATPATQPETIAPAAPDHLAFTTAPQAATAGACSGASGAALEARDVYDNVSPVAAATTVSLAATPPTGFQLFASAGCGGGAVTSVSIAAGGSSTSLWFRGTAAGTVTVTATGAGIPAAATQPETVDPGPPDHLVFDAVSSLWVRAQAYPLRAQAVDQYGNATPAFTGAATLNLTVPQPPNLAGATLSCTAGCASGTVTDAFAAGAWTGSVAVTWADADPQKLGVSVRAVGSGAYASLTGSSAAFDITAAVRSPPTAIVTASPIAIPVNQAVTFDASGSTDYRTPTASLEVSWDFQGTSTAAPAYPTPAAPWTAWTTTKAASNVYAVAGTYVARIAVRDTDGDVGYGSVTVVVLPLLNPLCIVTTASDVDDGATSCSAPGPDGVLSLAEALRVAANGATITFAAPYTISGTGAYTIGVNNLTIAAPTGTVLDGKSLTISATGIHILGLEMANQASAVMLGNRRALTMEDCYLHDMPGFTVYGTLTLDRVRMENCVGSCVYVTDASNSDTLTVRYSSFVGGASAVGLDISQCKPNKASLVARSNVFAGFATGVRFGDLCTGYSNVRNNTFASNGTGIEYQTVASPNNVLRNTIFSGHTTASVSCGSATFASRDYHLLYQNTSDGCLGADANTISGQDPLYLSAPAGDYRVELTSPAVDSAIDVGLFLLPQYPATTPQFLGAGPDRGGRESW